jgi:hypothetical protein
MKLLLRYISIIAAVIFMTYSCEVDENGPLPEDIIEGCVPYIDVDATASDNYIDIIKPDEYSFKATLDKLYDSSFDKITLVVVYNGNYDKQYVIQDNITTLPLEFTVTTANLIDAVPELNSSAEIKEGDSFHVFAVPTVNGKAMPPYQMLGGNAYNTMSSSVYAELANLKGVGSADVLITVPCAFSIDDYIGVMYCKEDWGGGEFYEYTVTSLIDPDYTGSNIGLIVTGCFDGADVSVMKAEISLDDFSFSYDEEQTLMPDVSAIGYPAAYGALYFSAFNGSVNTCEKYIEFSTDICVDLGCFGTATYTLMSLENYNNKSTSSLISGKKPMKQL